MTLREKLRPLWANYTDMYAQVAQQAAMAGALTALTEYAEKMERAGQPAAALGAVLMAEQLHGRASASTLGADA